MLQFYPCFPVNEEIDQTNYYLFINGFDPAQIESIVEIAKKASESDIKWIAPIKDLTEWIYDMMVNWASGANFNLWKFELSHFKDSIQYIEYSKDDNENHDWAMDLGAYPNNTRKISIIVELSNPSEYDGGDLEIKVDSGSEKIPKGKGLVTLFPSYILHRITPVTNGTKRCLVFWVGGSVFR